MWLAVWHSWHRMFDPRIFYVLQEFNSTTTNAFFKYFMNLISFALEIHDIDEFILHLLVMYSKPIRSITQEWFGSFWWIALNSITECSVLLSLSLSPVSLSSYSTFSLCVWFSYALCEHKCVAGCEEWKKNICQNISWLVWINFITGSNGHWLAVSFSQSSIASRNCRSVFVSTHQDPES